MGPKEILVQAIGIVAMLFSVFSFQMNTHKKIMLMQIGASVFFGVQYFLLGAYTGVVLDAVSAVRAVVYYHSDKKWAASKIWLGVFVVAVIAAAALVWEGPITLLMTIAMILNTFTFSFKKPLLVRSTILISSPFMLVYCILTHSLGGIVNEIFAEISSVVGMIRYDRKEISALLQKKK